MLDRLDPETLREIARNLDGIEQAARTELNDGCGECVSCIIYHGQAELALRLAADLRTTAIRHQHSQPTLPAPAPPAGDPAAEPRPARPGPLGRTIGWATGAGITIAALTLIVTALALVLTGAAWVIAWAWGASGA